MLTALDLVKGIEDNSIYADIISRTKEEIIRGNLSPTPSLPWISSALVVEMCSVGEQTGNMEGMLASGPVFETEVSRIIERLCCPVTCFDPFYGGDYCFIALSVPPMFEVYQTMEEETYVSQTLGEERFYTGGLLTFVVIIAILGAVIVPTCSGLSIKQGYAARQISGASKRSAGILQRCGKWRRQPRG